MGQTQPAMASQQPSIHMTQHVQLQAAAQGQLWQLLLEWRPLPFAKKLQGLAGYQATLKAYTAADPQSAATTSQMDCSHISSLVTQ